MESSEPDQTQKNLPKMAPEFRIVLDNVPAVLFTGYMDGTIDPFDRKVESMTGYSKEDFQSRLLRWTDLIVEEDQDDARRSFIKVLKTNKAYVWEYRIRGKQGNIIGKNSLSFYRMFR